MNRENNKERKTARFIEGWKRKNCERENERQRYEIGIRNTLFGYPPDTQRTCVRGGSHGHGSSIASQVGCFKEGL